jgi:excisionase family DNA binding protein
MTDPLAAAAAFLDERAQQAINDPTVDILLLFEFSNLAARLRAVNRLLARPKVRIAPATEPTKLTLTPREAAELLGISEKTLARLVDDGKLVPLNTGTRRVLFSRAAIEQFAAQPSKEESGRTGGA